MGYLPLASIALGIVAWLLPIAAIVSWKKQKATSGMCLIFSGMAAAILSLLIAITYMHHFISIEEWSAVIDTSSSLQIGAVLLSVLAIVLSGIALAMNVKRTVKN